MNIKNTKLIPAFVAALATSSFADSFNLENERAESIRSLVSEVLADAESRASFQGDPSPVTLDVGGFGIFRWRDRRPGVRGSDRYRQRSELVSRTGRFPEQACFYPVPDSEIIGQSPV